VALGSNKAEPSAALLRTFLEFLRKDGPPRQAKTGKHLETTSGVGLNAECPNLPFIVM